MKKCYNKTMKWKIDEIQRQRLIEFDEVLQLKDELMERNPEILDLTDVLVTGSVKFDSGFYNLTAQANYTITLPSSRSLKAVEMPVRLEIFESYVLPEEAEEIDESMVFILESDEISLNEVVADNILLEIPLQILTEDEEKFGELPHGKDWEVLSEEDYQRIKEEQKKADSPFAALNNLTTDED